jgi:GntR family transcriptional regulator
MADSQNIPLFFRLYQKLKHDIVTGEIQKGAKIDTIEELALKHGVSQTSIRKGLDLLEREGLLVKKQGWGTFVPENVDLRLFDMGRLIGFKEAASTIKNIDIVILSAEWVKPSHRIAQIFELNAAFAEQLLYKIHSRFVLGQNVGLKGIVTHYFHQHWLDETNLKKSTPPLKIIYKLAEWIETTPLRLTESLRPYLCTDETATILGQPDGTPVFYESVTARDLEGRCHVHWDIISTANIIVRELVTTNNSLKKNRS